MSPLSTLAVLSLPLVGLTGLLLGGVFTWALPVEVFVLVPLVELLLPAHPSPPMGEGTAPWKVRVGDFVIYSLVPFQWLLLVVYVWQVSHGAYPELFALLGATATLGLGCGSLGINIGHELGHRASKTDRFLAKTLLLSSLYQHFFIEHNRGHHAKVATRDDPASAWRGQSVYAFWFRSVIGSYRSAWALENSRLSRQGRRVLSLENEMVRFHLLEGALVLAIGLYGGITTAALFVVAAFLGALLLETVNYIEHYGLERAMDGAMVERVRPHHSWNSNHPLSRLLLFELTRHSDHHAHPGRKWAQLRHFDKSPQLPTGYPGLILLALVPPLWFRVMDRHLMAEQARIAALA